MTEPASGVLTVLLLFAICMLLGFVVVFIKNKYQTPPKRQQSPKVFYITESKKPKRKLKKKVTIPLEATVVKAEDLKKFFNGDK